MMPQTFSRCLLTLLLVAYCNLSYAASKPNIIIIVADDLGYADLGIHGCKDIHTPHIDSIAKMGSDVPTHMLAALLVAHPVQAFSQEGINSDLGTNLIPWQQKITALYLALHGKPPYPNC